MYSWGFADGDKLRLFRYSYQAQPTKSWRADGKRFVQDSAVSHTLAEVQR